MKKQNISHKEEDSCAEENRRKLAKAPEKAAGSLELVDIPGWETSKSAAKWVRNSRRSKDRFFATVRAIQQDNKDADPDQALADVTEAVEAAREDYLERAGKIPQEIARPSDQATGRPLQRQSCVRSQ